MKTVLFLLSIVLILQAIWPKAMWRITEGWRYKDPDLHEPSDVFFLFSRTVSVLLAVLLLWFVFFGST